MYVQITLKINNKNDIPVDLSRGTSINNNNGISFKNNNLFDIKYKEITDLLNKIIYSPNDECNIIIIINKINHLATIIERLLRCFS